MEYSLDYSFDDSVTEKAICPKHVCNTGHRKWNYWRCLRYSQTQIKPPAKLLMIRIIPRVSLLISARDLLVILCAWSSRSQIPNFHIRCSSQRHGGSRHYRRFLVMCMHLHATTTYCLISPLILLTSCSVVGSFNIHAKQMQLTIDRWTFRYRMQSPRSSIKRKRQEVRSQRCYVFGWQARLDFSANVCWS